MIKYRSSILVRFVKVDEAQRSYPGPDLYELNQYVTSCNFD